MARPGDPTVSTVKSLITIARGRCEFYDCTNCLIDNQKFLGKSAHIEAAEPGGPRYNGELTIEKIRHISNLLLLCPHHHDIIDNSPEIHTAEKLKKMKKVHEEKYYDTESEISDSEIEKIAWKDQFRRLSRGTISSIPNTINDETIVREEHILGITELLETKDRIVITGEKGTGKSVVLSQLCQHLIDEEKDVLFIKCEDYLGIENIDELNKILTEEKNVADVISITNDESNKLFVICDSLDAISRNENSMNLFKNFLKLLWGTNLVKTICSVRSYDYEYSPTISKTDWGTSYSLGTLTHAQLNETLEKLGNPTISEKLKNILLNPLHLKLLSLILIRSPNADFTNIKNEIELYDEYWKEYVETLSNASTVRNTLFSISKKMFESQRIIIQLNDFGSDIGVQEILSRNIIIREEFTNQIYFFHHAYLDYVISRFIIAKYENFSDFLLENEFNIFLRPTIVFALSVLNNRHPNKYVSTIEHILNSNLKNYWKISALTSFSRINDTQGQDFSKIGEILTQKPLLQRHFLMEVKNQANNFWLDLWYDPYFQTWTSKDNANNYFMIRFLKSISKQKKYHKLIFNILHSIIENDSNTLTKKEAIELSAHIDDERKVDWLTNLSTNEESNVRWGVIETLEKLIETDPHTIPKIFCNIFTYQEKSDETTQISSYGTLDMNSTKKQDNSMVIWNAGQIFPTLLEKNPEQMILGAIAVFEYSKKEMLEQEGDIVEDHSYIWYDSSDIRDLHNDNKLLTDIKNFLDNCNNEKFTELIPVFYSTRLAIFYSILLDRLNKNPDEFKAEIFKILSNPIVYKIETLRRGIRVAIKKINHLFDDNEICILVDNIMDIKLFKRELDEEDIKFVNNRKAEFLSELPKEKLKEKHLEILNQFSESNLEYKPEYTFKMEIGKAPEIPKDERTPEEIIDEYITQTLDYRKKIKLLKSISEYLEKKPHELNKEKFNPIKNFLLENSKDSDPKENQEANDSSMILHYDTIRGLVAKCLIQLLYHSKDSDLVPTVKMLSDDPINKVRAEVSRMLNYLFYYDYDLTYSITEKFSKESDILPQLYLPGVLNLFIHKNSKHATTIVRNILLTLSSKSERTHEIVNFLIYLALNKKEEDSITLLNKMINEQLFSKDIRCAIPFTLKESYLFEDEFQDNALEILERLLEDPENEVREKAAFFTLSSFENDEKTNNEKFVNKIGTHLDKIASEVDKRPWDPRLIEELIRFLEKFWQLLPDKTLDYLDKIVDEKIEGYSTFQPVFARGTIKILTGMFHDLSLSQISKNRCLSILDKFTMAGWEEALSLLSAIERPD